MMIRNIVVAATLALAIGTSTAPVAYARANAPQDGKTTSVTAAVNINTATQAELEKLPGIGPATAKSIVDYRQKNGGFKKLEELMNVKGIGEKSFLKLKPQITVTPAKSAER